ncbi:ATP-binding protein [Kutzneria buriramensis]|uniref:AAA ATPase-like protein n=1 Tax=Kutzneria buriramensis TaxID=1045776 RepID=A0A3E0ICJ8_9PSEU|nr:ATP-binding protein [Kutzneria buriramensis]REH55905.1 AAA ATPase-like protein [Kutzneria buriramensis]
MDLVGRARELRDLTQALDRAVAGHGDVLVLTGPRGAGTTALADAAVDLARERGMAVLRAGGRLMWTQVARDRGVPDEAVAPLLASPGPLDLDDVARRLVSAEPLLIVADDVDRSGGVDLLAVLAGRVGAGRTVVVATARGSVGVGREVAVRGLSEDELAQVMPSSQALWIASRGLPGIARELSAFGDSLVDIALNSLSANEFLEVDVALVRLLELAVSRSTGAVRARLLARLARELVGDASSCDRRRELITEAGRLADADPEVLDAQLFALWDPLAAQDRIEVGRRIATLADSDAVQRKGLFWQFIGLMELGQVGAAESVLAVFTRSAEAAGDGPDIVMALSRQAMLAALRGRFADATRLVSEFVALGMRFGVPDTQRLAGTILGGMIGDPTRLAEGVELMTAMARRFPGHFFEATTAAILVVLGRLDEAAAELHRVLPAVLAGTGPRWLAAMADLSCAAVATADVEAASPLYKGLLPFAGRLVVWAGANTVREPVSYWLGRLANVLGLPAVDHLRSAIALATEIGALPALERAEEALSRETAPSAEEWHLRRDGDYWLLTAGPEHARLDDRRGLRYLHALLSSPGKEIPALDLAAGGPGLAAVSTTPLLDETALRAYRSRLGLLSDDDPERAFILDELRRATGLGGRPRSASAEAERARVNVTRTLRAALDRIAAQAPRAAAHLQASIRTGLACRYDPGPGGPVRWRV